MYVWHPDTALLPFYSVLLRHYSCHGWLGAGRSHPLVPDHTATPYRLPRGNVTHRHVSIFFFHPYFKFVFLPPPNCPLAHPPATTNHVFFFSSMDGWGGWGRPSTQRSARGLPEVRASRPVQNASIVFCARQNTILKYYRHWCVRASRASRVKTADLLTLRRGLLQSALEWIWGRLWAQSAAQPLAWLFA